MTGKNDVRGGGGPPEGGGLFDTLAQVYTKAYLRWIDSTKQQPHLRPERIAEVVRLLERGVKQRPKG